MKIMYDYYYSETQKERLKRIDKKQKPMLIDGKEYTEAIPQRSNRKHFDSDAVKVHEGMGYASDNLRRKK